MVIVNDSAVRADGNVNARFFEILVAFGTDFYKCGRLSSANAFRFASDTDRAAAYADFDEIRAALG